MAKKMDMTKLDRIREASVEIISEHGILNSSVASIAERAGVSVGYLYRHYPGKVDLINDLLEDALRRSPTGSMRWPTRRTTSGKSCAGSWSSSSRALRLTARNISF